MILIYSILINLFLVLILVLVLFTEELWLFKGQVEDSAGVDFFRLLNGAEQGSPPSLTTRDRKLVSLLEVRIEPGI